MTVFINGRFLGAKQTGVQRVAQRLLGELDTLLAEGALALGEVVLLRPRLSPQPPLQAIIDRALPTGGQRFEQVSLAKAAAGGVLVNLANSAPMTHARNIVMFHDAQIRTTPDSYSPAFRLWYRVMQPVVARRAEAVVTVSAFSADQLQSFGLGGPHGPTVIPNGSDHILDAAADRSVLDSFSLEPGYVTGFASPQPHKNTGLLLDLAMFLPKVRFALVGRPPARFEPPANITFLGRIDDAALRTLYENALCLAFPSTTEGFGLPAVEAMACGCPVLAADAGALPEVCSDGAVLLPTDDPASWSSCLVRLADDQAYRDDLIARGRQRAEALTWRRSAEQLGVLLEKTLG